MTDTHSISKHMTVSSDSLLWRSFPAMANSMFSLSPMLKRHLGEGMGGRATQSDARGSNCRGKNIYVYLLMKESMNLQSTLYPHIDLAVKWSYSRLLSLLTTCSGLIGSMGNIIQALITDRKISVSQSYTEKLI